MKLRWRNILFLIIEIQCGIGAVVSTFMNNYLVATFLLCGAIYAHLNVSESK